jgi:cytochrome c biogenesis protein
MPFLGEEEIGELVAGSRANLSCPAPEALGACAAELRRKGYKVSSENGKLTAEYGKVSLLAATVTHVGLLLLLAGITVTSWTGFNGFKLSVPQRTFNLSDSEHSKLWIGKLPDWSLRVDQTRRQDWPTGEPRQWYSKLSVLDRQGRVLKQQEISVNHPLSFDGVDIYQSSWGLASLRISFNGRPVELPLEQMGESSMALMPVDDRTLMVFTLKGPDKPLRVFAKIASWEEPKLLAEIPPGGESALGQLKVGYMQAIPVTGLQYKSDPGLPITYTAFAIIILGATLAAFSHRQIWATAVADGEANCRFLAGGFARRSRSALTGTLEGLTERLTERLKGRFAESAAGAAAPAENQVSDALQASPQIADGDSDVQVSSVKAGVS